jgi:HEAT repeat protein
MDYSVTFVRHFARLVWLLIHQADAVDEQKAALRALMTVSKEGPVALTVREGMLSSNGVPLADELTGVQDLLGQFVGHCVREIVFEVGALPADVLGTARALATTTSLGDLGREVDARLRAIAPRTVRVSFDRSTIDVSDEVVRQFTAVEATRDGADDLFAKLDATQSVAAASRLLDQVVELVESSARAQKPVVVADLMARIVSREADKTHPEMKRAYGAAIRRLVKPTMLRAVAAVLPRNKERTSEFLAVLSRTGEEGADALIEELTAAQSIAERRTFFNALVKLKAGVPALTHMLGDPRWYVARNAADLLGELNACDAEGPLAELLKHDDDRVRRAATNALGKLGTPRAVIALKRALKDTSSHVRATAAAGLAARKGVKSAATLLRALESETDIEVQIAILSALGRVGTPEAVQRLCKAAEPETRLFKRKAAAYRVAAVQALGEARIPAAIAALQQLASDKDKEVREAAVRAVMHAPKAEPSALS